MNSIARKEANPLYAFHRFLEGIYAFYYDKGMEPSIAKLRMYKEVYEAVYSVYSKEEEIPDHGLVATMQHTSRMLNKRGASLSKKLEDLKGTSDEKSLLTALRQIKEAKDSIDSFVISYKGDSK